MADRISRRQAVCEVDKEMKFTKEDIESTIEEIKQHLHCRAIEHVKDNNFNIYTNYWMSEDFSKARELGLDVQGVMWHNFGKKKIDTFEVDDIGLEIEVEWIGPHRIVMGRW